MQLKTFVIYEFGPFRLEASEHRLLRDGQPVPLTPKSLELLLYLVENHGRLVLKDQIMAAVWSGSFVEEANLTVAISALRKALGQNASDPSYVETVPKKGYRFIASVKEVKSAEPADLLEPTQLPQPEAAPRTRATVWPHRLAIPVLALVVCTLLVTAYLVHRRRATPAPAPSVPRSLAILPLRNERQDPANDFLGYSLADAVITRLGPISSLTVRPSSAVEKYKGQTLDLPKVAAELNVDTLLTGNFIREGDLLRITYQLIDAKTERILGRDMIDVKFDKLLTVQDDVAREIIKGLELNLTPSEASRINAQQPISPVAYEYYLRGVDLMGNHDFPLAIKMLEKSTEIDPKYALTWAYLGQSYNSAASFKFGGRELYQRAQAAYERALALQPKQPEASMFLANLLIDTGKVEQAVPILRDVLRSNFQSAALRWELGYAYRFAGALQESIAECERARQIDPLVKGNGAVFNSYLYLGKYDKFLESLPDSGDSAFILFYRGFGEYHQKKWELARKDFDRAYELEPDPSLYTMIGKALAASIARNSSASLQILHGLENKIQQNGVGDPEATYKIAQAYAVLGDRPSAMRMFEHSVQNGFFCYPYFITDPLLDHIRREPRFPQQMDLACRRYQAFRKKFF